MNDDFTGEGIRWEPAGKLAEWLTVEIEREFHTSRPKPRSWAMGLYGDDSDIFPAHKDGDVRRR